MRHTCLRKSGIGDTSPFTGISRKTRSISITLYSSTLRTGAKMRTDMAQGARHKMRTDFFSALLKAQPQFLNDCTVKLWSRFFCLSVYVTMYLNDCQRTAFYEGIGLNTKEFDMHVIIETNRTTARIFPAVLDVENPEFKRKLDRMVEINQKLIAVGESEDSPLVKNLKRVPLVSALVSELLAAYLMPPVEFWLGRLCGVRTPACVLITPTPPPPPFFFFL
ncbi:hypothetical protein Droror1_Dr00019322 [Drosera rotundifolia]